MAIYKREYHFTGRVNIPQLLMPVQVSYKDGVTEFSPIDNPAIMEYISRFGEDSQIKIVMGVRARADVVNMGYYRDMEIQKRDDYSKDASYRLLVVLNIKILASGRMPKIFIGRGSESLLGKIVSDEISPRLWDLNFPDDEERVDLVLNGKIPGIEPMVLNDPIYRATIFPEVLRRIMYRIYISGHPSYEEAINSYEDWIKDWVRFAESIYKPRIPLTESPTSTSSIQAYEDWVSRLIERFVSNQNLHHKLVALYEGGADEQ